MTALETTIGAVAVYPDRARVTRRGSATLAAGRHQLEIRELPLQLEAASLRASASGTARARLLGVDARRDFYTQTPAAGLRELEDEIEALEQERHALDAESELLERERTVLGELAGETRAFARGLASGKLDAEAQMKFLDSMRQRTQALNTSLQELGIRRRDLGRRLQQKQGERQRLRGAEERQRYAAVVELDVTRAGDLTVEVTYVVRDAAWRPLYDLRLREENAKAIVEVGYLAEVSQGTGEDWSDVELTLSTARPALAGTLPELDPWYIGPYRAPMPAAAPMAAMAMRAGGLGGGGAAEAEPDEEAMMDLAAEFEAEEITAQVETSAAAVTYKVPGTVSIPGDETPHKTTVARFDLAPRLDYVSTPRLVAAAYRRARVANESPYTLLPGPANLFAGEEFIGTTALELIAPEGELEFYVGVDDRVKIERELKRREVDKKFLGDRRRYRIGYEIKLENLLATEARIRLEDQIPVSTHEEVKCKLESADPKPAEQDKLGILRWELALAPGEKQIVRFEFQVEHPRAIRVAGLP